MYIDAFERPVYELDMSRINRIIEREEVNYCE